jgi:hypothetical protein
VQVELDGVYLSRAARYPAQRIPDLAIGLLDSTAVLSLLFFDQGVVGRPTTNQGVEATPNLESSGACKKLQGSLIRDSTRRATFDLGQYWIYGQLRFKNVLKTSTLDDLSPIMERTASAFSLFIRPSTEYMG